jgi:hypothetical protein
MFCFLCYLSIYTHKRKHVYAFLETEVHRPIDCLQDQSGLCRIRNWCAQHFTSTAQRNVHACVLLIVHKQDLYSVD